MMKLIYFLIVGMVLSSCHDEYSICELPTEVRFRCGFYSISGSIENEVTVPIFTISTLGSASPIYNQQPNVSKYILSLNPTVPSTQYAIIVQPGFTDTLTVNYSTQKVTISEICPDIYVHVLSSATTTTHHIMSVKIVDRQINTTISEHLRIYL